MQNQNKFVGNSQSSPPPFQLKIFATVYVLQYSSFWNHKAKSYGIKTTSYDIKTTSYAFKIYKFDSPHYCNVLLGADYMGELSRLSELTRFAELTHFLLLFPIISTLRLHGKRVVPLRRDPG